MVPEFKLKVLRNPKNPDNLNYYITPSIEFEIFSAYIESINGHNVVVKLNLKKHLYIKAFLDCFTERVQFIDVDLNPNCYFRKNDFDEEFIIRIVNNKKMPCRNTRCDLKLRIKNIWSINDKSGTIFELVNFKELE